MWFYLCQITEDSSQKTNSLASSSLAIRLIIHHTGAIVDQAYFVLTGREVVRDGVLDDLDELDAGLRGGDVVLVEQLHHQASEPLEGPGDPSSRVDLDQHVVGGSDEHLQCCEVMFYT